MGVAEQVRKIYERCPYPSVKTGVSGRARWRLPPMEWINAVWEPSQPFPARILIAGCGTGHEAFALARRFPRSEIVAVDFSRTSIAIAKNLQRRMSGTRSIRFVVADLAGPSFKKAAAGEFDFVSCHGVLSYVPQAALVLQNLAHCLTSEGALYLGMNGGTHFSEIWRQVLPRFGFEKGTFRNGGGMRSVVALLDAFSATDIGQVVKQEPSYLAGDLFAPLIRNLPLDEWIRMCRKAGLHFRAAYAVNYALRAAINDGSWSSLFPRSRAAVAELLDILRPSPFHQLIFTRRAEAVLPWENLGEFLKLRPILTMHLRRQRWPRRHKSWHALRDLKIKMPETNTLIELRVPEWQVEILRNSRGDRPLRAILAAAVPPVPHKMMSRQLYLLHHLHVLNFRPPVRYRNGPRR